MMYTIQITLVLFAIYITEYECFNVTMASITFPGDYKYSIEENQLASLLKLTEVIDTIVDSQLVAVPEGYFWWYLPTRDAAIAAASHFVRVVNGIAIEGMKRRLNPCIDDEHLLLREKHHYQSQVPLMTSLSCLAKSKKIYLAANIATKSEGKLWNTEIVIDNQGYLLATYRKSHSFGGNPPFDAPPSNDMDIAWFSVPLTPSSSSLASAKEKNVVTLDVLKVGLLVCFDLEFAKPAKSLIEDVGVDAILMSQYWVNTPPISWSILYQQAWSLMHPDVTLIAINDGENPQTWGTGAYHGGTLVSSTEAFSVSTEQVQPPNETAHYEHILWVLLPVTTTKSVKESRAGIETRNDPWSFFSSSKNHKMNNLDRQTILSFPCVLPMYGAGQCVKMAAYRGREVSVTHGQVSCSVRVNSSLESGNENVVALAIDSTISTQNNDSLHLLLCGVLTCVEGNEYYEENGSGNGAVLCGSEYTSYSADAVSVRMGIEGLQEPERYQVLPMVAGGDFHTIPPHHLHISTPFGSENNTFATSVSLNVTDAPLGRLSTVSIFAVDQR